MCTKLRVSPLMSATVAASFALSAAKFKGQDREHLSAHFVILALSLGVSKADLPAGHLPFLVSSAICMFY